MIVLGDARQMGLADNSIDAIVTDPPYGLSFMGKDWDAPWQMGSQSSLFGKRDTALPGWNVTRNPTCKKCAGRLRGALKCVCAYPNWDESIEETRLKQTHRLQAWYYEWAIEALRVLKPGGYLLAMGGTRTFHRLTCALEDAGFEIRDTIMWLFGSGFPKSYNISKGFDRRAFKAWLDTVELDCCLVRDPRARKAQIRKAVSAAVGGAWAGLPDYRDGCERRSGKLEMSGTNPRPWSEAKREGRASEGAHILVSLLAHFWEPLNEAEQHGIWQAIIGDHEGCDVGMPPGMRVKVGMHPQQHLMGPPRQQATCYGTQGDGLTDQRFITAPSTPLAKRAEGFGSGLKPAWEPVIVARKPLCGTLCDNFEKWGMGGLAIDRCRIRTSEYLGRPKGQEVNVYERSKTNEPMLGQITSEPQGRWPANLILSHSEDCVRVGTKRVKGHKGYPNGPGGKSMHYSDQKSRGQEVRPNAWQGHADPDGYEQVEDWICVESCPVRLLDEQSGARRSAGNYTKGARGIGSKEGPASIPIDGLLSATYNDKGGASRFYKNIEPGKPLRFCYTAKASRAERTCQGMVENKEPTVKPVNLCRYLERLVARPGAVILDPFCGSGSFGEAAVLEGFTWIGIDNRLEACQIAKKRREWAIQQEGQPRFVQIASLGTDI